MPANLPPRSRRHPRLVVTQNRTPNCVLLRSVAVCARWLRFARRASASAPNTPQPKQRPSPSSAGTAHSAVIPSGPVDKGLRRTMRCRDFALRYRGCFGPLKKASRLRGRRTQEVRPAPLVGIQEIDQEEKFLSRSSNIERHIIPS